MGTTERVVQFIEYKGITKYKLCKDLGFSNKFLDNSSNMGTDKACKILHYFPELSAEWLLTGNGEMLKQEVAKSEVDNIDYKEKYYKALEDKEGLYEENRELYKEIKALREQLAIRPKAKQQSA